LHANQNLKPKSGESHVVVKHVAVKLTSKINGYHRGDNIILEQDQRISPRRKLLRILTRQRGGNKIQNILRKDSIHPGFKGISFKRKNSRV
jgi:hypothetical protein